MNLLIFLYPYKFFQFYLHFWKYRFWKKSLITRKILVCDIESWSKKISKIRNVTFIFQHSDKQFQKRKKIEKTLMNSEKSTLLKNKKKG